MKSLKTTKLSISTPLKNLTYILNFILLSEHICTELKLKVLRSIVPEIRLFHLTKISK